MESQALGGRADLTATSSAAAATSTSTDVAAIERELMLVSRYTVLATNRSAADLYLERSAYLLLSRIDAEGPMSIGELAKVFGLDTSTINRQTAAMSRSGLVERIADPAGGPARKLQITADGLDRLRANRAWAVGGIGRVLGDWDPDDLAALARLLTQFNTTIERRQGHSWPRPEQTHTSRP